MGEVWLLLLLLVVGFVSWALTGWVRCYAIANQLIDVPNARSSHTLPVPRGGGVAVVVTFMCSLLVLWLVGWLPGSYALALLGAGGGVAIIGFFDDHGHVAARWRLLIHFFAAMWALFCLGGMPQLVIFDEFVDLGWLGHALAVLYLVWLLNLYNFMDGIDGLAGIEAVTVCFAAVVVYALSLGDGSEMLPLLVMLVAMLGFLVWNFPKAKIFMGDACSGFVGMVLGVFAIQAAWLSGELFWAWLILLGVFIVDATMTLIRRVLRGDKFYQAHRSHAYQYAARKYQSHVKVSVAIGLINIFWLLPVSLLVAMGVMDGMVGLLVAYVPLVILAVLFKAGCAEKSVVLET